MKKILAVFFDLGSTLVYPSDPWVPIYQQASQALLAVLNDAGLRIDPVDNFIGPDGFIRYYYDSPVEDNREKTAYVALKEVLIRNGRGDVPETVLRSALDAMYGITQQNWFIEEDALPALQALKQRGYRLGMISNTSDDRNMQWIVDRWGLRPYFETVINSAAFGIRKPDLRIFQHALDQMKLRPEDAAMVGDYLETDVLGANQAGIYSIWITRRVQTIPDGELAIQPQAIVSTLHEIPDLLAEIQSDQADRTA